MTKVLVIASDRTEQNVAWIDPWTIVHGTSGLALGLVEVPFVAAMLLAIGYDATEQLIERSEAGQKFFKTSGPESLGNVIVDLITFAAGWGLGYAWNKTGDTTTATNPRRLVRKRRRRRSRRAKPR